jgi:hypothetical protein
MFILPDEGMRALFQSGLFLTKLRQHTNDTALYILQICLTTTDAVFYLVIGR